MCRRSYKTCCHPRLMKLYCGRRYESSNFSPLCLLFVDTNCMWRPSRGFAYLPQLPGHLHSNSEGCLQPFAYVFPSCVVILSVRNLVPEEGEKHHMNIFPTIRTMHCPAPRCLPVPSNRTQRKT